MFRVGFLLRVGKGYSRINYTGDGGGTPIVLPCMVAYEANNCVCIVGQTSICFLYMVLLGLYNKFCG
jgi:hypothetical protein